MRRASPTPFRTASLACLALAATLAAAGCGKKGPPLPPFSRAPAAPTELTARRQGDRVVIGFVVPNANTDGRQPANIDRVEVHGISSEPPPIEVFEDYAPVVGTVPVRRPPPPPPDVEEGESPQAPPPPPPPAEPGLEQHATARIIDELTPDELLPITIPELEEARLGEEEARARRLGDQEPPTLSPPDLGPPLPEPVRRYYAARGRSGGRKGAWSERVAVPLGPAPLPPSPPEITVTDGKLAFSWVPPASVRRPPQKPTMAPPSGAAGTPSAPGLPTAPGELPEEPGEATPDAPVPDAPLPEAPVPDAPVPEAPVETPPPETPAPTLEPSATGPVSPDTQPPQETGLPPAGTGEAPTPAPLAPLPSRLLTNWPVTTTGYVVDEVAPPGFKPPPLEPGQPPPFPVRLTKAPLPASAWTLSGITFGVERCFVIRTVETSGALVLESEPSPVRCVTPADTFAPPAPSRLAAIASEGSISLIWEASPAPDLAGYIVLRGEAGGDGLRPILRQPIRDTTYRDTDVEPGIRYAYAVVAVDTVSPPNVSDQSNQVEETAR